MASQTNGEQGKQMLVEKATVGKQRGGTKHENENGYQITFTNQTGIQDLDSIRDILNEALQGGQDSILQLSLKVQELIEGKKKDTELIEQLRQKTEELSNLLKEERERNEKHRTEQEKKAIEVKEKEINELKQETVELKQETEVLKEEIEQLKTSLKEAEEKQINVISPVITDLSDPNRPQSLCEKFNTLYDNIWTDAFEIVYKTENTDKLAAEKLIHIFRKCWEFCCTCADKQLEILVDKLLRPVVLTEEATKQGLTQILSDKELKIVRECRKSVATHSLTTLSHVYWKSVVKYPDNLKPYVSSCLEICWYAAVNDPRLDFNFDPTKKPEDFREYKKSGKYVDFLVWPAMYIQANGPLLYKGVAEFRDSNKDRDQM